VIKVNVKVVLVEKKIPSKISTNAHGKFLTEFDEFFLKIFLSFFTNNLVELQFGLKSFLTKIAFNRLFSSNNEIKRIGLSHESFI
jgi:hypothetical protein